MPMNYRWIPLALALACVAARAELGGVPLAGSASVATAPVWRQWQSHLPNGDRIDEYAGADGQVFAVTWQGPAKPDLQMLLGPGFQRYLQHAARPRGPGASRVAAQDLVVSSGGHMGAFQGAAWIPSRLPAGFDPASLR